MARPGHLGDSSATWRKMQMELFKELGMQVPYEALAEIRRIRNKRNKRTGNTENKTIVKILLAIRDGIPWAHAFGREIEYIVPFKNGGKDRLDNVRLSRT